MDNINFKKVLDDGELFQQQENYEDNFEKINQFVVPKITDLETNKVDKVAGKGLSTNDFNNEYKAKIDVYIPAQLAEIENGTGISAKAITPEKTSFFKTGKNLFNKATVTTGYLINNADGTLYEQSGYVASDYIEIEPNTIYTSSQGSYMAYYDANKAFVSGITSISNSAHTFTTPSGVAYIRQSIYVGGGFNIADYQLEKGSVQTAHEPFMLILPKEILEDKPFSVSSIPEKSISPKQTDFIINGKNIFNKENAVAGYYVSNGNGLLLANASYTATGFVEVEEEKEYTSSQGYYMAFYDANKNYLSGLDNFNPTSPRTFTTPVNTRFIRQSVYTGGGFDIADYQIELGNQATALEPFGYKFAKDLPAQSKLEMILAPKIYALVGQELNIYFDNIMNDKDTKYDYIVTCAIGKHLNNCYRVAPTAAGTFQITIIALVDGVEKAKVTSSIIVKAVTVGNAVNKKVLVIGDSTTASNYAVIKLVENFNADVMNIETLGTQGYTGTKHEGRSGWTANKFLTDATSPFVFGGVFSFSQYLSTNAIADPDYVIINLGINDFFTIKDDAILNTKITTVLAEYQAMIDSIKAYSGTIKIGIALTIPPAYDQESFGKALGVNYQRWRIKRNVFAFVKSLISYFKDKEAQWLYIIPININLDTRYNMGLESLPVNARNTKTIETIVANGHVHPSESGYWQIADIYWYWLKSFEV